jgi:hypothetical protein
MAMMITFPNKIALWQDACYFIQEEHSDIAFLIQDKAYLDSLEGNLAVVGVKTWTLLEAFERKRVVPLLEKAFSELTEKPIRVKLAHGRPRICEPKGNKPSAKPTDLDLHWKNEELGALHAQYGDIISIVDYHPVFVQACKPLTEGGWGIFNRELTNACKDYGADVVLKGLRDVANRPKADRPRSYFFTNLRAGVYGHKLATSADAIGPIAGR